VLESKAKAAGLAKEMVAFAKASGGSLDHHRIRRFLIKLGLPETTAVDDLLANIGLAQKQKNRLLLTRAVPRNRLIADMFYRLGYVERLGSGIYRMRSAMAAEQLPAPHFIPTGNAFRVELFSSFNAAGLSEEEAEICQWLSQKGRATSRGLQDAFSLAKATMHRRLVSLMKDGWIKTPGSGRGTFYTIDYGQEVVEPK